MTGIAMAVAAAAGGSGGIINPLPITDIGDDDIGSASASLSFNTDGTISVTGLDSSAGPNWRSPTLAGIGSSYWYRLTVNSGTSPTGASVGAWIQGSVTRTWTWTRVIPGVTSAACTIEVSGDSGGVSVVGSDTFNVAIVVT
jgi:hypothetical protein